MSQGGWFVVRFDAASLFVCYYVSSIAESLVDKIFDSSVPLLWDLRTVQNWLDILKNFETVTAVADITMCEKSASCASGWRRAPTTGVVKVLLAKSNPCLDSVATEASGHSTNETMSNLDYMRAGFNRDFLLLDFDRRQSR